MFFGNKSCQNPRRGVPAPVKRQLFLLVGLFAGTLLLGLQFWSLVNRQAERGPLAPAGGAEVLSQEGGSQDGGAAGASVTEGASPGKDD